MIQLKFVVVVIVGLEALGVRRRSWPVTLYIRLRVWLRRWR
jgi:hypothetical protein